MDTEDMSHYERYEHALRKIKKWQKKADKAVAGADYQWATIKIRKWEQASEYWHERSLRE